MDRRLTRLGTAAEPQGLGMFHVKPSRALPFQSQFSVSVVPGTRVSTIRARSSSPANSIVILPFFDPRVTLTLVSKTSDSRVDSAGSGALRRVRDPAAGRRAS